MKYIPEPHHTLITNWVLWNNKAGVFAEPGLGKTGATLTAIQKLINTGEISRVLVLAPIRVALTVWPAEIKKWDHLALSYTVIFGTRIKRAKLMREETDIHIATYEQMGTIERIHPRTKEVVRYPGFVELWGSRFPYDVIVLDESTRVSSAASGTFKAVKRAVHTTHRVERVIELTGTPAAGGLQKLWAPTYLMDKGARLGTTLSAFRERWFQRINCGNFVKYEPYSGAQNEVEGRLKDLCVSLSAEEYSNLPPIHETVVRVELSLTEMEHYCQFENDAITQLHGEEVNAINGGALTGKLLQWANGAIFTDPERKTWKKIHDHKMDALDDLVEESCGSPLIVAYRYRHDAERILKRYKKAKLLDKNPQTVSDWNAGKISMLVMHPRSGGHGLNLQDGGHRIVWFGLNWDLELVIQLNGRLQRKGQTKPVFVYYITAEGTADELVAACIEQKKYTSRNFMDALRARVNTLRG